MEVARAGGFSAYTVRPLFYSRSRTVVVGGLAWLSLAAGTVQLHDPSDAPSHDTLDMRSTTGDLGRVSQYVSRGITLFHGCCYLQLHVGLQPLQRTCKNAPVREHTGPSLLAHGFARPARPHPSSDVLYLLPLTYCYRGNRASTGLTAQERPFSRAVSV